MRTRILWPLTRTQYRDKTQQSSSKTSTAPQMYARVRTSRFVHDPSSLKPCEHNLLCRPNSVVRLPS